MTYSAFIVADKVTLETRSPYSENGVRWVSSGDGNYEIEEISKENRGTEITLHLKDGEEYSEFLEEWKIKDLVKKYSNYIRYEIYFKDEVINSTKPVSYTHLFNRANSYSRSIRKKNSSYLS